MRRRIAIGLLVGVACSMFAVIPPAARAATPGLDGKIGAIWATGLYLIDPSTGIESLATDYVTEAEGAIWAPSGDLLAVYHQSSLSTIRPDGTGQTLIPTDGCLDGRPTWDPTGTELAYRSCSGVSIYDLATSTVTVVPNSVGLNWLAWSPDGQWIAAGYQPSGAPDADIWKIRPDGSDLTQVTNLPGHQLNPTWSPDGSRIAFEDWVPGSTHQISVIGSDGGAVTQLTHVSADLNYPSWSPSGGRIAYHSAVGGGALFTMAVDGSDVREIPVVQDFDRPEWQPAQVTLRTSKRVVDSGSMFQLAIRIAHPGTDVPGVLVEERPKGGAWGRVGVATVDSNGKATLSVRVRTATSFRATWQGDATYVGGRSLPVAVLARAVVTGQFSRFYATQGKWHLYLYGRRVWYTGHVKPPRPGERMCFHLEVVNDGVWSSVPIKCFKINADGNVKVYLYDVPRHERGRLRAAFHKTPDLLGDRSRWGYFRMTG